MNRCRALKNAVLGVLLMFVFGSFVQINKAQAAKPQKNQLIDIELKQKLLVYLEDINKWIMNTDVGSNWLKNVEDPKKDGVWINGNLARVLMASYRITGNKTYLNEALSWCDHFYEKQQIVITSTLEEGGYCETSSMLKDIYFGDGGTANTAFAVGYRLADNKRQKLYLKALERYARFIRYGSLTDPQKRGRKATESWIIKKGKNKGAIGCGYYKGHLSTEPYTIATATTGGCFFSQMYALTSKPEYKNIAKGAVNWIIEHRKKDGEIRYLLDGLPEDMWDWPLDTITYCTEAFIASDMYLKDPSLTKHLRTELKSTIQWLLDSQNPDGSWGELRSDDQQRSPCVVSLLNWYYHNVKTDPEVAQAVQKYCCFLLNPENSEAYGVKELVRTTGFVGLVVAELLQPECTF